MNATEIYRPSPLKRERRSKSRIERLDAQIIEALKADNPQSVRHLFYLMTNPRLPEAVEKSDRGYRHVQDRIVKLRRSEQIPYSWITDATRRGYFVNTYRNAGDFIDSMKAFYRADLWQQSEYYCEVWCESRSIAGVVQTDCEELAVSLYPAGGFSSLSLPFEAAKFIEQDSGGKPVVVLYIGDYDPAGVLIDVQVEKELRSHLPAHINLDFRRIAITAEQIGRYDLPKKPRKATDRRALHIQYTVEAEAMPAGILRELLRSEIQSLLPTRALEVARLAEDSERHSLDMFAEFLEAQS